MVLALSSEIHSIEGLAFQRQDFPPQSEEFDLYHAFVPFAFICVLEHVNIYDPGPGRRQIAQSRTDNCNWGLRIENT